MGLERDSSGVYSVQSAYKWLKSFDISGEEAFYNKVVEWRGTTKGKSIQVEVGPSPDPNFAKFSYSQRAIAIRLMQGCGKEVEIASHLFFKCELFSMVWYECLKWWGIMAPLQDVCKIHFGQFFRLISGSKQ